MFLHGPGVKLCVWHAGRSGSTVLGSLMKQDSRIVWAGEVLHDYSKSARSRTGHPLRGAKRLIRRAQRRAGRDVFGIEMKIWHLKHLDTTPERMLEFLNRQGYRHFLLERRNLLRLIISGEVARESGVYHVKVGDSAPATTIRVERETIADGLRIYAEFYERMRELLPDAPRLTYEDDILPDPCIAYRKVLGLLDMKPEDVTVGYRRTNARQVLDILTNGEEIAAWLRDTKHAWMLDG